MRTTDDPTLCVAGEASEDNNLQPACDCQTLGRLGSGFILSTASHHACAPEDATYNECCCLGSLVHGVSR